MLQIVFKAVSFCPMCLRRCGVEQRQKKRESGFIGRSGSKGAMDVGVLHDMRKKAEENWRANTQHTPTETLTHILTMSNHTFTYDMT